MSSLQHSFICPNHLSKIKKEIFKLHYIELVRYNSMFFFNIISRQTDVVTPTFSSVVCEMSYKFTNGTFSSYIGITKRSLFISWKKHENDLKYNKFSTTF